MQTSTPPPGRRYIQNRKLSSSSSFFVKFSTISLLSGGGPSIATAGQPRPWPKGCGVAPPPSQSRAGKFPRVVIQQNRKKNHTTVCTRKYRTVYRRNADLPEFRLQRPPDHQFLVALSSNRSRDRTISAAGSSCIIRSS